jgi:hypothetical protein
VAFFESLLQKNRTIPAPSLQQYVFTALLSYHRICLKPLQCRCEALSNKRITATKKTILTMKELKIPLSFLIMKKTKKAVVFVYLPLNSFCKIIHFILFPLVCLTLVNINLCGNIKQNL